MSTLYISSEGGQNRRDMKTCVARCIAQPCQRALDAAVGQQNGGWTSVPDLCLWELCRTWEHASSTTSIASGKGNADTIPEQDSPNIYVHFRAAQADPDSFAVMRRMTPSEPAGIWKASHPTPLSTFRSPPRVSRSRCCPDLPRASDGFDFRLRCLREASGLRIYVYTSTETLTLLFREAPADGAHDGRGCKELIGEWEDEIAVPVDTVAGPAARLLRSGARHG